jgi:hypothetical protein
MSERLVHGSPERRGGDHPVKKLAVVFATVFALVGGSLVFATPTTLAQCDPNVPTVQINGGSVSNSTSINLNADGGTAISDASGGDDNVAFVNDGGDDFDETAAAGNAGTAESSANGGAIAVGDVNSGGNTGNTIEVGDTVCAPAHVDKKPAPAPEKKPAPAPKPGPAPKAPVAALPNTGVGDAGDVNVALIALALVGAVAAAGYSVRTRFNY